MIEKRTLARFGALLLFFIFACTGCAASVANAQPAYQALDIAAKATAKKPTPTPIKKKPTPTPTKKRTTPTPTNKKPTPTNQPTPTPTQKPTTTPTTTPAGKNALSGVRICLDPGHQKKSDSRTEDLAPWSKEQKARTSSGTQGIKTKVEEYVYTLEFSNLLAAALRDRGAEVKLTRTTHDVTLSNIERAQIGNDCKAAVVLRIHCDGSENASKNGIGLFVGKKADKDGISAKYAKALLQSMVDATGAKNNGVNASDTYTGLNWSEVPSLLVELGYMSNAEEDQRLNTKEYKEKLVKGIVNWCVAQFGK